MGVWIMKWERESWTLLSSSGLTSEPLAATVMWRAKQDSHKTFIESIPGPAGQNKLQKQSVTVREAFWCRSVKNTACSVVLIGKHCHQSPSTWTVNLLDMIVQLSSHPNPQILTSWRIYIYVYVPFKSRPQETLNQTCLEPFFLPTNLSVSKLSVWVHSHPLPRTPAHPCSDVSTAKPTLQAEPEMVAAGP